MSDTATLGVKLTRPQAAGVEGVLLTIGTMAVASFVGWGLVVNLFVDDASWNNWQGYLLGPLGLGGKDGAWAYANMGVLAALVIGLLGGYLLRRSTVRRQEAGTA